MTPLDRITGRRIDDLRQWRARLDICQHVRGDGEIGARWRIGSNSPVPFSAEHVLDPSVPLPGCHFCGAPGDDIKGSGGWEFCPACGETWLVGDYDWTKLSDCIRYREDLAAGLIDEPVLTPEQEAKYRGLDEPGTAAASVDTGPAVKRRKNRKPRAQRKHNRRTRRVK